MGVFLSRQFGKLTTNDELDNQAIRVQLRQTGFEFSWPFLPREVEENVVEALGLRESSPRQEERMRALLIEIFRVDSLKVRCFVLALSISLRLILSAVKEETSHELEVEKYVSM